MIKEKGKKITIDELARIMNKSFKHLEEKMVTKDDIQRLEGRLDTVEEQLSTVDEKLDKIDAKIDINHENRISKLEDDMRVLKTSLGK
ncbi:MAG: hypothetical protein K0S38_941 [Candidatus Paceibacter sp.]|jgi:hypothetical protein|nr:hypothetical protein [Candidatus Paceibacter sp.]